MLLKSDLLNALRKHFEYLHEESCKRNNGIPLNSFTWLPLTWIHEYIEDVSNVSFISDDEVKNILFELYEEEFSGSLTSWCWGEARYILFKVWQEKKFYRIEFF